MHSCIAQIARQIVKFSFSTRPSHQDVLSIVSNGFSLLLMEEIPNNHLGTWDVKETRI